jgi:hypothetical protein
VRVSGTKPSSSTGTWVGVDYLKVGTTVRQQTAARHQFRRVVTDLASQGSYDTVPHRLRSDTGGAPAYSLRFRGQTVELFGTRTPSSGSARIYIDGNLVKTVSFHSTVTEHQVLVDSVTGLTDQRHTLRVVPVGTTSGAGSAVNLDRIQVSSPPGS